MNKERLFTHIYTKGSAKKEIHQKCTEMEEERNNFFFKKEREREATQKRKGKRERDVGYN